MASSTVGQTTTQFIAEPMGALSLTGTGSIETLQQITVPDKEYNLMFDFDLASDASAAVFMNCFELSGKGTTFSASLSDSATFAAILENAIRTGELTAAYDVSGTWTATPAGEVNSGVVIDTWYRNRIIDSIKRIYADTVPNILQSNWTLETTVGADTAASGMASLLTPFYVENIAQQIPYSNYSDYKDASENPVTSALPLVKGNSLVFRFMTTLGAVLRTYSPVAGSNVDTGYTSSVYAEGPSGTANPVYQNFASENRIVAVRINMPSGSGAIDHVANGLNPAVVSSKD